MSTISVVAGSPVRFDLDFKASEQEVTYLRPAILDVAAMIALVDSKWKEIASV
jgi:hypothetical protein